MRMSVALFALSLSIAAPVVAQDAESVVQYRQSIYQVMKWQFGGVRAMLVGDREYDAAAVDQAAQFLASAVTMLPTAYAEGSITGDSDALPKIWEEWSDFSHRLDTLAQETAALDAIDGTDQAAITEQFKKIGGVCKDCHDNYKKD